MSAGRGAPTFSDSRGPTYRSLLRGEQSEFSGFSPTIHCVSVITTRCYFLDAFASQVAAAIERAELTREAERRQAEVEAEQLRNALLSSVSHDLRTPLAVITGSASTLSGPTATVGGRAKEPPAEHPRRSGASQSIDRKPSRHDPPRIGGGERVERSGSARGDDRCGADTNGWRDSTTAVFE